MKVALILPPAENTVGANIPEVLESERGFNPPLGLLYIASYLQKHSDHEVRVFDTQVEQWGYDDVKKKVEEFMPRAVGIQTMSFTLIDALLTAKAVKSVDPQIYVVLGGAHVNLYPDETINLPDVDCVVLGEGEKVFTALLNHLADNKDLRQIPGLVYKNGADAISTSPAELIQNLDELPFPARELTPWEKYGSILAKKSTITTMMTSRGCPYRCSFCHRPQFGKKFRSHSPEYVVNEIEHCIEMGIQEIFIHDDIFTLDKRRVLGICKEILRRDLKFGWDLRARVNNIDMEMLEMMRKAGCERIQYGVESGNQQVLNYLQKGITIKQVKHAFKMTMSLGIKTLADFIIGAPYETREQINESIDLLTELDPDYVQFSIMVPYPGTELYKEGLKKGAFSGDFWRDFARSPSTSFTPETWNENLTREELDKIVGQAYRSFYLRPRYIIKKMGETTSLEEFFRKVKGGVKLLRI